MKKFLFACVLSVALLLCLPLLMGFLARHDIEDQVAQINTWVAPPFQLEIKEYHQGWFSSTVHLSLGLDAVILHGPIIIRNKEPKLQFGIAAIESKWGLNSLLHFSGELSNEILIPTAKFSDAEKNTGVDWAGLRVFNTISKDGKNIDFQLSLQHLGLSEKTQPLADVANLKLNIKALVENDKLNAQFNYQQKELTTQGIKSGPSYLNFEMRGLGLDEWVKINNALRNVNLNAISDGQMALLSVQLLPTAIQMIDGAAFNIDSKIKFAEGDLNFQLLLSLGQNEQSRDVITFIKSIQGRCAFSIPKSLLKSLLANVYGETFKVQMLISPPPTGPVTDFSQATQLADKAADESLSMLLEDGWLKVEGDRYVGSYELKEGKILSNGQVILDVFERYVN